MLWEVLTKIRQLAIKLCGRWIRWDSLAICNSAPRQAQNKVPLRVDLLKSDVHVLLPIMSAKCTQRSLRMPVYLLGPALNLQSSQESSNFKTRGGGGEIKGKLHLKLNTEHKHRDKRHRTGFERKHFWEEETACFPSPGEVPRGPPAILYVCVSWKDPVSSTGPLCALFTQMKIISQQPLGRDSRGRDQKKRWLNRNRESERQAFR